METLLGSRIGFFYKRLFLTPLLSGSLICRGICVISLNPALFWKALKQRLKIGTYLNPIKVFVKAND